MSQDTCSCPAVCWRWQQEASHCPQEPPEVKRKTHGQTYVYPRRVKSARKWQKPLQNSQHQISPCLLPPPLTANAITTGSCPTSEVPHNSPTVIRRGLSHSSSSHCQRQAPSLGTQAWGQKNKSTRAEKKAFRAIRALQPIANMNCTQDRSQFLLQL